METTRSIKKGAARLNFSHLLTCGKWIQLWWNFYFFPREIKVCISIWNHLHATGTGVVFSTPQSLFMYLPFPLLPLNIFLWNTSPRAILPIPVILLVTPLIYWRQTFVHGLVSASLPYSCSILGSQTLIQMVHPIPWFLTSFAPSNSMIFFLLRLSHPHSWWFPIPCQCYYLQFHTFSSLATTSYFLVYSL